MNSIFFTSLTVHYSLMCTDSTSDNQTSSNSTYSDICVSNMNPTFDGQYIYDGHANGAPSWWKSGDIDYFLYKTGDWFLITADSGKGWDWTTEHGVAYCNSVSADGTNPNLQSNGGDCMNQWEYYDDTANTFVSTPAFMAYGQCSISLATISQCDYSYPDAIDISKDNRIDNITIYDTIELSFDLRIDPNFSCPDGWCNILRIGVPYSTNPKFPMIALTPDSFWIAVTENTGNEAIQVTDVTFLNQLTNGSYHHLDVKISPTERVLVYNGHTVYINETRDYNSDYYLGSQGAEYSLLVCGDNPYTPTVGTVKNLCVNTYHDTPSPTIAPTVIPTVDPTNQPTVTPTNEPTNTPTNEPTRSSQWTTSCDYSYIGPYEVVEGNIMDSLLLYEAVEIRFELRTAFNFTCTDTTYCSILRLGADGASGAVPKLPNMAWASSSSAFRFTIHNNHDLDIWNVDNESYITTFNDGEYHQYELHISPGERKFVYDDIVYVYSVGDEYDSSDYLNATGREWTLQISTNDDLQSGDAYIRDLCIRTYPVTDDPTMDPTAMPTANPTLAPTMKPTISSASITLHCDNSGTLFLSQDGGDTFVNKGDTTQWETAYSWTITNVTDSTLVQFSCSDAGMVGGFIATIHYEDEMYSTTNPIEDGYWTVVSSDDGVIEPLVYREKSASPWYRSTDGIEDGAVWIWNGNTFNTMIFQFDFSDLFADLWVHRNYTLSLNGDYDALEMYAISTNQSMHSVALGIISSLVASPETVIEIYDVRAGSVIIDYGLNADADTLNETESNFNTSIGSVIVLGNVTLSVSSNSPTTPSPTISPSIQPTLFPTTVPSINPTKVPSLNPTLSPTQVPTQITGGPSISPSIQPTASPSYLPTTPSPTHPDDLICGSHARGEYNGWPLRFVVKMSSTGYLQFDASDSDFIITGITALDVDGNRLAMDSDHDDILLLEIDNAGEFVFVLTAGKTEGIFVVDIVCDTNDRRRLLDEDDPLNYNWTAVYIVALIIFLFSAAVLYALRMYDEPLFSGTSSSMSCDDIEMV